MGGFDLDLINEFRSRPALYDHNCPEFEDEFSKAHQWEEISNKLSSGNPSAPIESHWPQSQQRPATAAADTKPTKIALLSTIIEEDDSEDEDASNKIPRNSINTLDILRSPDTAVTEKPNKKRSYQCTQAACSAGEPPQITPYQNQPCPSSRELSCAAFGNFVALFLQDSTQNAALELIGQLTSELGKSLLEKSEDSNGSPTD
uniref:MADF domain-containing protein n=1 Tax=Glossina austeni TaxID=7395 RepID=A0A1A9UF19_GLOAU